MSIDTLTPLTKDALRDNFQRSRLRKQDHGTAGNSMERDDSYDAERAAVAKKKLAQKAFSDELASLTPSQLEARANEILLDASADLDEYSQYILEENADREAYWTDELDDDSGLSDEERAELRRNLHDDTHRDRLESYGSLGLSLTRRVRDESDVDRVYQGTPGDDEDVRADIARGFKFTDRP